MNTRPAPRPPLDSSLPAEEDAERAAVLQGWLAQQPAGIVTGWPALCIALGRGLPLPPQIAEGDFAVPAVMRRWEVWLAGPPKGVPPPSLPITVRSPVHPDAWIERLRSDPGMSPIAAVRVGVDAAGRFIDPLDGLADGAQRRLRLTGTGRDRPRTGAAEALELAVTAAWTGLIPGPEAVKSLRRDATGWMQADRTAWRRSLNGVLLGPCAGTGLQLLLDVGALPLMVSEATAMVGFHKSCPVHHKDIWAHTLEVIEKCPADLVVRWAALMHDTGKVLTRSISKGKVHFFGHEAVGALLMEGVAARLGLGEALRDRVTYVIAHHARANAYLGDWTDSAVRRLVRELGEHLEDVLAFSRSDWSTKRAGRIAEVKTLTEDLATRIPTIVAADQRIPPLPKGLGTYVLQETGLQAGPWLGRVQAWLEQQCDEGALLALQEPDYYLDRLRRLAPELLAIEPGTERARVDKTGR